MQMLLGLEPRCEERGSILLEENQEVDEVTMFETGTIAVGFELNKQKYFVLRLQQHNMIAVGGYCLTHDIRSEYVWKVSQ